jgi:adenine-specific DNA-methyltransferase
MNKLKQTLEKALKSEPAFFDSESGELNYTKVKDSADKIDEKLISLLADNKDLKNKFFIKIKDVYVFNIQGFKFFLDESRVDNSYTQYANKIGLADNSGLLENRSEVVLDFPFKDCVLEGGQSTEEGTDTYFEYSEKTGKYEEKNGKRNEVFFNQVLAHDEIDRLYDRKALVNWKRFTKDSKKDGEAVKEIKRDKAGLIQENLIIKGNNLLALHSLKSEFAGKIKLIYIDPPYNTQGGNQIFTYNNNFNHSTWLTFMKNRLDIAKTLLTEDGVLEIAIDENEQAHLALLIDEVFPDYERHCITIVHNPRGVQGNNFSYTNEFVFFVFKKGLEVINKIKREEPLEEEFKDHGGESLRTNAKNCFYPIIVKNGKIVAFGDVPKDSYHPKKVTKKTDGTLEIYPIDVKGIERKWVFARQTVEEIKDKLFVKTKSNGEVDIFRIKDDMVPRTVWIGKRYDASTFGSKIVNKIIDGKKVSFPKSLYAVYDCLSSVLAKDKDAIILDFFGGSGTTAHATVKLNEDDGGNRKFILVEQLDEHIEVAKERIRGEIPDSFIYCELAKWNEKAKEEIQNAKDLSALVKLFDTLYEKYFLNYNVRIKDFKDKIIKEENFKKLTLAQQKKMFLTMLDLNQMYVQESEMADKKYGISSEDQKLTKAFYSKK